MIYRQIGKTGQKASIVGLGCEHLDNKPYEQVKDTIETALSCHINLLDVFMPGQEVRENIARALGPRRKDVLIQGHIGSTDIGKQYDISRELPVVKHYFENLLRLFGHIDFGMMFFIDDEDDYKGVFETGFADYVLKLKQNGDIGHIGFSSHHPLTAIRAINTGLPELMLFSINPAFDMLPAGEYVFDHSDNGFGAELFRGVDPMRTELYQLCEQKQIGITVMKTLGAGKLISPEHTPFAKPLTVQQCMHYALTRPAVSSVMVGCKSGAEVLDAVRYLDMDDEALDYAVVLGSLRNDFRGNCLYCSHCQPCPVDIDIASVIMYLDIARLDKDHVPPSVRAHYQGLNATGQDCVACGSCEARCPFGVEIIQNMAEAERLLG